MTHRLYYTDAYRTEFTATVVERDANGTRVYLDASAFYPTSGGQPHDLGRLADIPVVDVIDEDDRIAHLLASPLDAAAVEARVNGQIDWARRYDHMQQHTGQHLLSAVFEDLFGARTVSVHFGADYSTLDLDAELITRDQLMKVESRANEIVAEARPVMVTFEDSATATGLRKPSDRPGLLRIVTIDAIDRSACGGTHVRTTAEIGAVFVRSTEKIRKATRVEFVCGERAIRRARRDYETLGRIAASLSSSLDDVASLVATQGERVKELDTVRRKQEKELAAYRMRERYDGTTPDTTGVRRIVVRDATSIDELRTLAQTALDMPKVVVIGALTSPPSVLVAASEDSGFEAGKMLKERLAAVGGKGGGSPRMAQGSVPGDKLDDIVRALTANGVV